MVLKGCDIFMYIYLHQKLQLLEIKEYEFVFLSDTTNRNP